MDDVTTLPLIPTIPTVVGPQPNSGKGDKHQHDHLDPQDRFKHKPHPAAKKTEEPGAPHLDLTVEDEPERGINIDIQV